MATRSLTEVFILMRNNALQSRHMFSEHVNDDRMALVSNAASDMEMGSINTKSSRLPPEWVDGVEEVQYEMTKIKTKMKELATLHDRHLNRPTLDDNVQEEHAIEIMTQDITQMSNNSSENKSQRKPWDRAGKRLAKNIVSSVARSLQDMSLNFRKTQSDYLRKIKSREERSREFFDTNIGPSSGSFMEEIEPFEDVFDKGFTSSQLHMVEDNTVHVKQREKEIAQIVQSITDLNEIFKDLATMVVDQGTILDRIDYNVENASVQVDKGLQQLQKAEKYQKKNRKMLCIVILAAVIILLLIILIAVKR